MQFFDISIAPGQVRTIDVQGSYVYFVSGSAGGADATIALRNETGGDTVLLKPGQALRLRDGMEHVRWVVSNYRGEGTITGVLFMGSGDFRDNRISGSVEVVDGGKSRTLAGAAFMGYVGASALAPNYPYAQIWNPVGSGKFVVVEQIALWSVVAGALVVTHDDAARASLGNAGLSKRQGGSAPVAEFRYEAMAARHTTGLTAIAVQANVTELVKFTEPVVLPPGAGLSVFHVENTVNTHVNGTFEWYEENL